MAWLLCSVQAKQVQQCRASLWAIVPDRNCQWSEPRVKYQPILHPCSVQKYKFAQKCMFCSILAPLLCWIGQVHRVFDDLKGHRKQRFPLHLHEGDSEEDRCHVVLVISTRGQRGSISTYRQGVEEVPYRQGVVEGPYVVKAGATTSALPLIPMHWTTIRANTFQC